MTTPQTTTTSGRRFASPRRRVQASSILRSWIHRRPGTTTSSRTKPPRGGTSEETFPKQNVEYVFCFDVTKGGQLPSGPFFVQFTLSGDQDPPKELDFAQDAGLDAGASVKAVVHFGQFPNKFASYHLEA